jgi:hypothetical protein
VVQGWLVGWDQLWVVLGCCCLVAMVSQVAGLVERGWGCCAVLGWLGEQDWWLVMMGCFLVLG